MGRVVHERQHARRRGASLHQQPGFTMVELTIVVLVIGILIAVAIPTFLGSRSRAQNRAAQSDLRSALVGAKAIFSTNGSYQCARAANGPAPCVGIGMPSVEPSLTYVAGTTASLATTTLVSIIATPTTLLWAAARMSKTGTCFGIRDVPTGAPPSTVGTWYGQGTAMATCTGNYASSAVSHTPNKRWT